MPVISSINLHRCQSFDQFKRNWKYSGRAGDRTSTPTSTANDIYLNSNAWYQNTFNWSNVDVSTDYTKENNIVGIVENYFILKQVRLHTVEM